MTATLAARVLGVIRTAVRTARNHDEAEEAKAVLAELTEESEDEAPPEQQPAAVASMQLGQNVEQGSLAANVQAENNAAQQAAYGRIATPEQSAALQNAVDAARPGAGQNTVVDMGDHGEAADDPNDRKDG